jgi:hypothetical protein
MSLPVIPHDSPIQPLVKSDGILLTIGFSQSRSPNIKTALNIAVQAQQYCQIIIDGTPFNLAAFGKSNDQCSLAIGLLSFVFDWKGTHVYINGRPSNEIWRIQQVLECYQKSMRCNDFKAHCHTINDHLIVTDYQDSFLGTLFSPQNKMKGSSWLHPCSLISSYYQNRLDPRHPSTLIDQMQAHAVSHECDWCPNFNASNLQKIK